MGCPDLVHPVLSATSPRAQSGGGGWTARSWGIGKPIHFPLPSESWEGCSDLNHMVVKNKKVTRSGWKGEETRPGHGLPPQAAPRPHLWPPINIFRGRRGWWPWQGRMCANLISGSARSRWSQYSLPAWSAAHSAQTAAGCSAGPPRPLCSAGLQGWAPRRDTAGHKLWSLS